MLMVLSWMLLQVVLFTDPHQLAQCLAYTHHHVRLLEYKVKWGVSSTEELHSNQSAQYGWSNMGETGPLTSWENKEEEITSNSEENG